MKFFWFLLLSTIFFNELAIADSCVTFRDEFSSESYSRNDGTSNWATSWIEVSDNNAASDGNIEISNNRLQLEGDGSGSSDLGAPYIYREANLSTYSSATLTFDYSENGNWGNNDDIEIHVSNDGGSNWSLVHTFSNDQGNSTQQFSQDISAYISNNSRIAFVEKASSNSQTFFFDNVQIEACSSSNPVAQLLLHMDEESWDGTADEVIDSSGNNNNGTSFNSITTKNTSPAISGDPGTCRYAEFDGVDDYISSSNLYNQLKGTASMSFWVRTTQTGNDIAWQSVGITGVEQLNGEDDIFWGWLDAAGHIGISVGNDSTSKSSTAINDGNFHHIVLTRSAVNGAYKIYVDGVLEKSGTIGTGVIGNSFSNIGRIEDTGGTPNYFNGDLDELQIFNTVIDDATVLSLMAETQPCSDATPQLILHFDEESWDETLGEVIDSSSNNNNATGINGVIAIDSSPAIIGDPGTCGYASFDGVNDYIALDNFQNLTGSFSFTAWVQSTKHSRGRIIADDDTSGFALSLNEPSPGYLRFYSRSVTPISLDTSSVVLPQNDGWYFVSIVHDAGSKRRFIYVDGVLVASDASAYSGTWPSDSGVTTIGSESNASLEGVNFAPFKGNIDEVQIFTEALTQAQIQSLMTETHACTNESTPDPAACNFVSGDYSLYGATSINLAHNITVNGQTVSSGNYSPDVAIDNTGNITTNANPSLPALNPSSFPTNTATNDEISNSDISINSSSEVFYDKIQTKNKSSITFTGGGPFHIDELNTQKEESEINFAAGTYYIRKLSLSKEKTNINITSSPVVIHIGSSFDIDKEDININKDGNVDDFIVYLHSGATFRAQKENVDFTGLLYGPDAGGIRFDKENIDFHGLMITGNGSIEVKKEDFSLTFTEADKTAVNAILGTCDAALDHFELSYSANGLTCLPSAITLKACANADCSSLYTENVDVTLDPATGWENNPVTISSGSASLELQHTTVEDVVVDITNSTVNPTGALQCFDGDNADATCTINFAETGFIFDVPTLTACKTSADVTIQAVRKSNITDQCVGALTGTQSVNFWSTYLLPSTGTKSVAISGNTIDKSSPGSSVDLEFDINGEASFTVQYDDAGQLQLDASHTLTTTDGNLTIAGNDTFVSKPVALAIYSTDNSADCSAGDASCSIFKKAGESFDLEIKAACWVDNDDSDYSNNPVTANFELASIGLDHSLIAPSGGNLGSLSNASVNFTTSDNGVHTVSQSVSEVGVFTFDLNPPIYFGESINTAASDNIGRFYPDHFEVTATDDGAFSDYACGTFSYSGQSFNYTTNPTLTISAYNAADTAVITQNYTGDFVKLVASNFRFTQPTTDALQTGVDGNLVQLEMSVSPASLTDNADGSLSFAFGNDSYTYRHISNSKIAPFSNAVKLEFTAINDDDGVQTQDLPISLQPSGEPIRFGRFSITNAHGSELIPLPVQIQTEYFNGANWQSNSADQCTTLNLASHLQLANTDTSAGSWQSGTTTMTVNNGSSTASLSALNSGQATLTFSAPGEDNQSYIDIRSQLSANYDWLLGDYDNDGGYDDEATARASFGLFKGSDNIIFRREVY